MSIAVYGCAALPSATASAGRAASWARQPSARGHPNKKAGELVANRGNRLKVDGYLRQRTVQFAKRVTEIVGRWRGGCVIDRHVRPARHPQLVDMVWSRRSSSVGAGDRSSEPRELPADAHLALQPDGWVGVKCRGAGHDAHHDWRLRQVHDDVGAA